MTDEERADKFLDNLLEDDYVKALLTGRVLLAKKLLIQAFRNVRREERAKINRVNPEKKTGDR